MDITDRKRLDDYLMSLRGKQPMGDANSFSELSPEAKANYGENMQASVGQDLPIGQSMSPEDFDKKLEDQTGILSAETTPETRAQLDEIGASLPSPSTQEEDQSRFPEPKQLSDTISASDAPQGVPPEAQNGAEDSSSSSMGKEQEPSKYEQMYQKLKEKYSGDTDAAKQELADAQANRDVRQLSAGIFEGLSDVATGGKTDAAFYDRLRQGASSQIVDLEQKRKLMSEALGVDERLMGLAEKQINRMKAEEMSDPNHPVVKQLKLLYERQVENPEARARLDEMKKSGEWENIDGNAIKQLLELSDKEFDRNYRIKQAEENRKLREATAANTEAYRQSMLGQKQAEEKRRVSTKVNDEAQRLGRGDKIINKVREQSQTFDEVEPLLKAAEQGNEAAIAALGTKMARSMGEVGVLTDADVTRYLGNTSYARQVSSWASRKFEGELPKGQIQDMQKVVDMLQDVYQNKLMKNYNTAASVLMSRSRKLGEDISEEEAHELLGTPGKTELDRAKRQQVMEQAAKEYGLKTDDAQSQDEKVVVEKDGKKFRLPKRQMDQALKEGYKLAQ